MLALLNFVPWVSGHRGISSVRMSLRPFVPRPLDRRRLRPCGSIRLRGHQFSSAPLEDERRQKKASVRTTNGWDTKYRPGGTPFILRRNCGHRAIDTVGLLNEKDRKTDMEWNVSDLWWSGGFRRDRRHISEG